MGTQPPETWLAGYSIMLLIYIEYFKISATNKQKSPIRSWILPTAHPRVAANPFCHPLVEAPAGLVEGVGATTEPPAGMTDSWNKYDDLTELNPDLAAEVAKLAAERGPDWRPHYRPIHTPPGYFVIVEYVPKFDVWSILRNTLFHDADDARSWLLEEIGPAGSFHRVHRRHDRP